MLAFAVPAFAYAAAMQTDKTVVYSTDIQPISGFSVPLAGRLEIRTSKDGIITGFYRPADNNNFVPVTGGVIGDRVWIDIGHGGATRVDGRLQDGTIVGTIFSPNSDPLRFTAKDAHVQAR